MQPEIEAKFLNVEHSVLRERLQELGAVQKLPSRLMRRKNLDFADRRLDKTYNGWVRVRDEGDKATLSYKQVNDRTVDGTKEVSVDVSDFDDTCLFLESIGLNSKSYQETKRESWTLDGVDIELDEWPWVKPFIEVEAQTEQELNNVVRKLNLHPDDATHGSVEIVYMAEYNVTEQEVNGWDTITFEPVPDWLDKKRKSV